MLRVRDLHAYYGRSHIIQGVNLSIGEGEIVSLLGRNGVGRSTTIKAIMGLVQRDGSIVFKGREISRAKSFEIAGYGIGYVPESRDIFPTLTVRQNLLLGEKRKRGKRRWSIDDMLDLFPHLRERSDCLGGILSGGEKQMLTMCRTLMGDPDLIMVVVGADCRASRPEPTSPVAACEQRRVTAGAVGRIRKATVGGGQA